MKLYVDKSRLLPASDPLARQIHISQGTFLELLDIAAREFGYRTNISYFPEGEYASAVVEERPVAALELQLDPSTVKDSLFSQIPKRHTNKRPYDVKRPVSAAELAKVYSLAGTDRILWRAITSEPQRTAVAEICREAMAVETSSPERNRETANWFRFSDHEMRQRRDGFGIAQNGVEGPKKWIAETFILSRKRAADPKGAFAQGAVTQTEEQADSTATFVALISKMNTRLDQVVTGRAYARVDLTAARLGLKIQPFSQVLEEYPEMAELQKRMKQTLRVADGHTVQMLFRLGHAKPGPHTPRRDISALIRTRPAGT